MTGCSVDSPAPGAACGHPVRVWWQELRAAALVGTGRREPPWPDALGVAAPADATREELALHAAALGDAVRRAGRRADHPDSDPAAADPAEARPSEPPHPVEVSTSERPAHPAPPAATQILELLIRQRPLGDTGQDRLLRFWLAEARATGYVLPASVLPAVLDLATRTPRLRSAVVPVLGPRGSWLAGQNPAWRWAERGEVGSALTADQVAALTGAERTEALGRLRMTDPAAARAVIAASWLTDPARVRAAHVPLLGTRLSPDDEELLESALDDRAREVRLAAAGVLDLLPESARATRMARRLRDLVQTDGTDRTGRRLRVALPHDPDAAAVRDGLVDPGAGTSRRAWWLHRVVTGAPLAVWTDLVGTDRPEAVLAQVVEPRDVVLPALREVASRRRDLNWCRALLGVGWEPRLLAALPAAEQQTRLAARLAGRSPDGTDRTGAAPVAESAWPLTQIPAPWGPELSLAVVDALRRDPQPAHAVRILRDTVGLALHPSALPALERLADREDANRDLRVILRDARQFSSLHRSIAEAFRDH